MANVWRVQSLKALLPAEPVGGQVPRPALARRPHGPSRTLGAVLSDPLSPPQGCHLHSLLRTDTGD